MAISDMALYPPMAQIGGALDGVESDVELRSGAVADALADRKQIAVGIADHQHAVDADRLERSPHRLGTGAVRRHEVAASHQTRRSEGRRLGHAHGLQGQVSVHSSYSLPCRGALRATRPLSIAPKTLRKSTVFRPSGGSAEIARITSVSPQIPAAAQ